jgi:hypothetical protein
MAFRTEAKTCACLILCAVSAAGAQTYEVRHKHLRNGVTGVLRIDDTSLSFEEKGKYAKHSRVWKYEDIQRLTLSPDELRIVTYEDNRMELGRDRVYLFDNLPAAVVADWYPVFRTRLDARFVAALADEQVRPDWEIPVKLVHGRGGSQGVFQVGPDLIVYKSAAPAESRTWRTSDLESVSTSGEFDLTLTTHEREFRFQLKKALSEPRFQQLWERVNRARRLQILK